MNKMLQQRKHLFLSSGIVMCRPSEKRVLFEVLGNELLHIAFYIDAIP